MDAGGADGTDRAAPLQGSVPAVGPPSGPRARRWVAVLLSLLAPGLGHLAIGHPRRMVMWFSSLLLIVVITFLGAFRGAPATVLLAAVAAIVLRIAAAADTVRLPRPPSLPRGRAVLLMVIGFFAFWEIVTLQVRARLIEAFKIPSGGMAPTLLIGDHVFATKLDRSFGRGDVIVFKYPQDPRVDYVKRIVAVGGDTVEIRTNDLWINGQLAVRTATRRPCRTPEGDPCELCEETLGNRTYEVIQDDTRRAQSFGPLVVPPGSVFVLGDNRDSSSDSRVWGPVPDDLIVGKVTGVWWSSGPGGVRRERLNLLIR